MTSLRQKSQDGVYGTAVVVAVAIVVVVVVAVAIASLVLQYDICGVFSPSVQRTSKHLRVLRDMFLFTSDVRLSASMVFQSIGGSPRFFAAVFTAVFLNDL